MLKIEVIRFEAEDVITASVEAPVEKPAECIGSATTYEWHAKGADHTLEPACPASEHPNCKPSNVM